MFIKQGSKSTISSQMGLQTHHQLL